MIIVNCSLKINIEIAELHISKALKVYGSSIESYEKKRNMNQSYRKALTRNSISAENHTTVKQILIKILSTIYEYNSSHNKLLTKSEKFFEENPKKVDDKWITRKSYAK